MVGWNEHVKKYVDESKFWYAVWISAGKTFGGDLFVNIKQSKTQSKFAVRSLKRCVDKIKFDRFVSGLLEKGANFFQEIQKARGIHSIFSSRIDEEVGSQNIANHFADMYKNYTIMLILQLSLVRWLREFIRRLILIVLDS